MDMFEDFSETNCFVYTNVSFSTPLVSISDITHYKSSPTQIRKQPDLLSQMPRQADAGIALPLASA